MIRKMCLTHVSDKKNEICILVTFFMFSKLARFYFPEKIYKYFLNETYTDEKTTTNLLEHNCFEN